VVGRAIHGRRGPAATARRMEQAGQESNRCERLETGAGHEPDNPLKLADPRLHRIITR
jgi:hypothetical protein